MAITRIPESFRLGLAKIRKLSSADVEALKAALSKSPPTGGMKGMIATICEQVPALKKDDAEDIARTLYSLYVIRTDADILLAVAISELISAMRASGTEPLMLSEEEEDGFQNKMEMLLSLDAPAVAAKVEQLKVDYPKTFYAAKILTDIRPIFAKPEQRPVGGAITHMLKIEYHEEGKHKEFYVALDAEHLQKLKAVLQRAEAKASSLKSLLKAASLADLS